MCSPMSQKKHQKERFLLGTGTSLVPIRTVLIPGKFQVLWKLHLNLHNAFLQLYSFASGDFTIKHAVQHDKRFFWWFPENWMNRDFDQSVFGLIGTHLFKLLFFRNSSNLFLASAFVYRSVGYLMRRHFPDPQGERAMCPFTLVLAHHSRFPMILVNQQPIGSFPWRLFCPLNYWTLLRRLQTNHPAPKTRAKTCASNSCLHFIGLSVEFLRALGSQSGMSV